MYRLRVTLYMPLYVHAATQPDCDEYSDINTHSEIYSFSSAERGERSIMICSDSQPPQNHRLLANSSDIGTTRCPPTNASGPGINTIIIIIISIMVIIVII